MIDLHTHTTFSDGTLTPTQLVEEAAALGLERRSPSPTTTRWTGCPRRSPPASASACAWCRAWSSTCEHEQVTMDVLGYFLAGTPSDELEAELAELRRLPRRAQRAHPRPARRARLPARRRRAGRGGGRRRRRPPAHRRGHGAARLRRLRQGGVQALSCGAAHPPGSTAAASRSAPPSGCSARRAGCRCWPTPASSAPTTPGWSTSSATRRAWAWPASSAATRCTTRPTLARCLALAERYALVPTGGSDYHGTVKPDIHLGVGARPERRCRTSCSTAWTAWRASARTRHEAAGAQRTPAAAVLLTGRSRPHCLRIPRGV